MNIPAIIPVRSGSVGLKDKNIRLLGGKPLVAWAIEAAKKSKLVDKVIVDTDSEKYAEIARSFGAETPFMRPPDLAEDVPTEDVLTHAFNELDRAGYTSDIMVCLQCTTPLVYPEEIDACVVAVAEGGFDSSMTVAEVSERPEWMFRMLDGRLYPINFWKRTAGSWGVRQTFPKFYRPNGACYAMTAETLMRERRVIADRCTGVVMPRTRSLDVDNEEDFRILEAVVSWEHTQS